MADSSKTAFGLKQISNETPQAAQWIFRGYFILSKVAVGYISGLAALKGINITATQLGVIMLTMSSFDLIMYGFSKLFGIVPDAIDPSQKFVADKQIDKKGNTNAIPETVLDPAKK